MKQNRTSSLDNEGVDKVRYFKVNALKNVMQLWFSFILGLKFYFILFQTNHIMHYHTQKHKKSDFIK